MTHAGCSLRQWLLIGLGPWPIKTAWSVVLISCICGFIVSLIGRAVGEWLRYVIVAPLLEELICHLFLIGWLMTFFWFCAAPQTTIWCAIWFAIMHIPFFEWSKLADIFAWIPRFFDGLIIGFSNAVACLVYVRLFSPNMSGPSWMSWLVAYGALVLVHAAYNFLAQFSKSSLLLLLALRVGGALFAIAIWYAWMPYLL
ncbi:MAG: hypothetical protein JSW59_00335 [Phycisphaerales bacterium]|nr:MAG: hypothetical protein JSW59_00335 [Phycisphaerales bacterium]